jgi:hypothetical protein
MTKILIYVLPLLIPLLVLISVNAVSTNKERKNRVEILGVISQNSKTCNPNRCSWACYENTEYCKKHHVKHLKNSFSFTDPIYFGMIKFFKSLGNYAVANILFLVLLWPLLMYILLVRVLLMQQKIKAIRQVKNK